MGTPKLSQVQAKLKQAAQKLSEAERAALQEAIRATRRALASGNPDDVAALVKKLESIAQRPAVHRALQKLSAEALGNPDKQTLVRLLQQAAQQRISRR